MRLRHLSNSGLSHCICYTGFQWRDKGSEHEGVQESVFLSLGLFTPAPIPSFVTVVFPSQSSSLSVLFSSYARRYAQVMPITAVNAVIGECMRSTVELEGTDSLPGCSRARLVGVL